MGYRCRPVRKLAILGATYYDYPGLIAELRKEFFLELAPAEEYESWIGQTVDDVLQAGMSR